MNVGVDEVFRRIRLVPDELRRFRATGRQAWEIWGLSAGALDELVGRGLPHDGRGDRVRFDEFDLGNLALYLGYRSAQRRIIRSWGNTLRRVAALGGATFAVKVAARCPEPDHPGECRWRVAHPDGYLEVADPADVKLIASPPVPSPPPQPVRELATRLDGFQFWILPSPLREDTAFLREHRLSDCGGAALILIEEAAKLGLAARRRCGLLLSEPYAGPHFWTEVCADGTWHVIDPMLLWILTRWGKLDPASLPPGRSAAQVLLALPADAPPFVRHDGVPVPSSYACRVLESAAA